MAETSTGPPKGKDESPREPTPFERMTELARKIIKVPRSELPKAKQKRKRR